MASVSDPRTIRAAAAEARRQKLLARGGERLNSITVGPPKDRLDSGGGGVPLGHPDSVQHPTKAFQIAYASCSAACLRDKRSCFLGPAECPVGCTLHTLRLTAMHRFCSEHCSSSVVRQVHTCLPTTSSTAGPLQRILRYVPAQPRRPRGLHQSAAQQAVALHRHAAATNRCPATARARGRPVRCRPASLRSQLAGVRRAPRTHATLNLAQARRGPASPLRQRAEACRPAAHQTSAARP